MKWLLTILTVALVSCSTSTTVVNHDRKVAGVTYRKNHTEIKKKKVMGITVHKTVTKDN